MNIGLIDIEPKIFNTALMQISYYHKSLNDTVKWALPLEYDKFDKLYCSSLFDFTDKSEVPERAIKGGTGFSLLSALPFDCKLDYSIYPKCITSYVWFTRGCFRKCSWCVVPKKEGNLRIVRRKKLNPNGQYITIMDNDFFANPEWDNVLLWLDETPVDIQGIDVRAITDEQCKALVAVNRWADKRFKIAWDNPKDRDIVLAGIARMTEHIKPRDIMCYVLIGYYDTPEADLFRVETLRELGITPFVMPYDKFDDYQKKFARWVNRKEIFNKVKWQDYKKKPIEDEEDDN